MHRHEALAEADLQLHLGRRDREDVTEFGRKDLRQAFAVGYIITVAIRLLRQSRHQVLVIAIAETDRRDGNAILHQHRPVASKFLGSRRAHIGLSVGKEQYAADLALAAKLRQLRCPRRDAGEERRHATGLNAADLRDDALAVHHALRRNDRFGNIVIGNHGNDVAFIQPLHGFARRFARPFNCRAMHRARAVKNDCEVHRRTALRRDHVRGKRHLHIRGARFVGFAHAVIWFHATVHARLRDNHANR